MRTPNLPEDAMTSSAPTPRGRVIILSVVILALALATAGVVTALSYRSSPTPAVHLGSKAPLGPAAPAAGQPPTGKAAPNAPVRPADLASSKLPALADGAYPAYVRHVDVDGARITIDVVQAFEGEAAADAAIADGTPPSEAQYLYVYIRNQNAGLRTLPVTSDVRIDFVGTCEAPPDRHVALTKLASETTPFNTTYYYTVSVRAGAIDRVVQHLAIPAC